MKKIELTVSPVLDSRYENTISELVYTACQYKSSIFIATPDEKQKVNAKSIMGIIAVGMLLPGTQVVVIAEGSDEEEAILALQKFLA